MSRNKVVHFVSFETLLDTEEFNTRWQEYTRSDNIDRDVTLQQSLKGNGFIYIAQHRCMSGEMPFVFEKARRSSRVRQIEIVTKLAGGYSKLQSERNDDPQEDETKIFAFIPEPVTDLNSYKNLSSVHGKLNIYEPYYENCKYAYILEFFEKSELSAELLESLKQKGISDTGIYKECVKESI